MKANFEHDIQLNQMANTVVKTPAICLYDISESMEWNGGAKSVEESLEVFIKTLQDDNYASQSIDFSTIAFNHETNVTIDFTPIKDIKNAPKIKVEGGTDLNNAILVALDMIEKQKSFYKQQGIKYKAGWITVITDGESNTDITEASIKTNQLIEDRKLTMICIGAGTQVNLEELNKLDNTRPVIFSPQADDLVPLFEWLSNVTIAVNKSRKGDKVTVAPLDNRYEFIG